VTPVESSLPGLKKAGLWCGRQHCPRSLAAAFGWRQRHGPDPGLRLPLASQSPLPAEVKNFDPYQFIDKKEARKMGRFTHYAFAAYANEALTQSGLQITPENSDRVGVLYRLWHWRF